MNGKRDYYYKILGLKPGAEPAEIKAAYRRLVKLYHPDRDQSPDTEIMYREIRTAYETLLKLPLIGTDTVINRDFSGRTSQASTHSSEKARQSTAYSRDSSRHTTWTSEGWEKQESTPNATIHAKNRNKPLVKGYFVFFCAVYSSALMSPHSFLCALFHVVSWIYYLFFRNAILSLPESTKIVVSVLYGTVLFFLSAYLNADTTGILSLLFLWLFAASCAFILMIRLKKV